MGRFFALLFMFILVVPLIRMVVGILARAFTNYTSSPRSAGTPGQGRVPAGGTLRKDPVCGTFVSENVAKTLSTGGKTHHFCSEVCLKKFQEQLRES